MTSTRVASSDSPDFAADRPEHPEALLRAIPTHIGGHGILALVGELDVANTHTVLEAVARCLARRPDRLSLDLSGLNFCDVAGVRTFREVLQRAEADKVDFRIMAATPWMRRVFSVVAADDLLALTPESLRPAPPAA